jgi:hypothetical protein
MSASQQELAIEKDKERLRYKAEQNVIRNLRFRDARYRTIGIDEQALREQIQDNDRRREDEKEDGRIDRECAVLCCAVLCYDTAASLAVIKYIYNN